MSTNKFQYWPSDGQLGSTKFTMPTNAEDWPSGDALIGNFVYNEGKLVDFIDIKALVANESKSTTFPYDYVNIQVDKSLEDVMTFNRGERTKNLTITYTESGNSGDTVMFKYRGCKTVDDVKAIDPDYLTNDIVDGVWSESLADLERTIPTELEGPPLGMFCQISNLTTFNGNLKSLINGYMSFTQCFNLTSFTSDLRSLTNGFEMFLGCKLDTASLKNIAETINNVVEIVWADIQHEDGYKAIHIGIGSTTPTDEENQYLTQIHERGWQVFVNGSFNAYVPATAALDETGETMSTPISFWAKPVPATEEDAQYVDADGNFYNILGGQFIFVDDPETYGMFTSLEDAAANMRLTKIEK